MTGSRSRATAEGIGAVGHLAVAERFLQRRCLLVSPLPDGSLAGSDKMTGGGTGVKSGNRVDDIDAGPGGLGEVRGRGLRSGSWGQRGVSGTGWVS